VEGYFLFSRNLYKDELSSARSLAAEQILLLGSMGTVRLNDYDLGVLCMHGIGNAFKGACSVSAKDNGNGINILNMISEMYADICNHTRILYESKDYKACTFHAATGQHSISLHFKENQVQEEQYKEPKRADADELMAYCKKAIKEEYEVESLVAGLGALCRSTLEDVEIGMFFFGIVKMHLGFKEFEPSSSFVASKLARKYMEAFN